MDSTTRLNRTELNLENLMEGLHATLPRNGALRTVLVMDSSGQACALVTERLQAEGYRVICAGSPSEAMKIIEDPNQPIYMVFLMMEGASEGVFEILEQMKERIVPRCVVTSVVSDTLKDRLKELDVDYLRLKGSGEMIELQSV